VTEPLPPAKTLSEAFERAAALDASLNEKLAAYARQSRAISPRAGEVYDRVVARLSVLGADDLGPRIGEPMPDFLLPDQNGTLVGLPDMLREGPLVISINRGHWCPYCRLDLRALAQITPEVRRMGGSIVSIMPELAGFTKNAIAASGLPFPILSDLDLSYVGLLGLMFWMGPEMAEMYGGANVQIARYQGNSRLMLPIAGKFVVDRSGIVRAREVNLDFRMRMEPAHIVAALARLV